MPSRYIIPFFLLLCTVAVPAARAQLIVNEFSQGASGNKEYIELVVKGQRSCNDTCADIRGWIFDDNNGWYGSTAISPGCYRFKNDPVWSCVKYGAIIVIYNSGDPNGSMPPDDPTDANNDGVYILPVTSALLEMHNTLPSGSSMNYPSAGFTAATTWTNMALNNTNDAVQVIDPSDLTTAYHAVSYGGGVVAPVHITASGSQKVYYLSSDQYNTSSAWVAGAVPTNETPGAPNTPANAAWIGSMSNASGGVASNDTTHVIICQPDSFLFNGNYYHTSGFHTAIYVSASGCDSVVTLDLTANPVPAPPVVVSPVTWCQESTSLALTAAGAGLLWYDAATGGTGSATAPSPGTGVPGVQVYYVSQTVAGCESHRDSIQVLIKPRPLPPVVASDSIVVCQGAPAATLTAQGQDLLWYNQPGGTPSVNAPVINTGNGHTEIFYVTQTVNGCESLPTRIDVRVSGVDAIFSLSADTLCIPDSISTSNTSIGRDYLNHWDFGDGFSYVSTDQTHHYQRPGVYTVTLALTNADGCHDTARRSVWVSPVPEVRVTPDKYHLCTGDEVHFNLEYLEGFARLTWNFGEGNDFSRDETGDNIVQRGSPASLLLQHAYDTDGMFFFHVSSYTPGCGQKDWLDSVTVHAMPKIDLGQDSALCLHGAGIPLKNAFGMEPEENYLWSTGETTPEITAKHPGDISLTINTPYCSNTGTVHISKDCYIDIPNAFTPNNDGVNDYFFPRQLLSASVVSFQMQVLNRWGQLIFETQQTDGRGWDGRFNSKDQPQGVYIYLIKAAFKNGASETYRGNVTLLR